MTTMCIETTGSAAVPGCDDYEVFLKQIQYRFNNAVEWGPLFTTNVSGLWDAFLAEFPAEIRQHYRCNACRRFVETYGGLVVIDRNGMPNPAVWPVPASLPGLFYEPVEAAARKVLESKVDGVFYSSLATWWGQPVTTRRGEWHHMAVSPPSHVVYRDRLLAASQAMAAKKEDYGMLRRALAEYRPEIVEQALAVLRADALYRGEHVLGVAEWLRGLQASTAGVKNSRTRENLVWRAVATAPAGFCHVRSSMIGTLLDDLRAGLSFDEVSRRFAEKMNPLQYQRPQVAPRAGNIAQAEKVVSSLAADGSLDRRYATLGDLRCLWRPRVPSAKHRRGGVFGYPEARGVGRRLARTVELPESRITWVRFRDQVLPGAERIEYLVPDCHAPYLAFVTAVNPEAPPILQWDSPEYRNPVSWYIYSHGSQASCWNLVERQWVEVEAVVLQPSMWHGTFTHHGQSAVAVLRDCRDVRGGDSLALFPEILRSEFHGVRATIEAYSRTRRLGEVEKPACGIRIKKSGCPGEFRVTAGGVVALYKIDRWE